jgi:hypothetical protein
VIGLVVLLVGAVALAAGLAYRSRPNAETPLEESLRRAPGVVKVEVALPATGKSPHWIVHILDYHLVPHDLYGEDGYSQHLDRVEQVQNEHIALLRWLTKSRGLSEVFVEGLTEDNLPAFLEKVRDTDELGNEEIPRLLIQLAEARESGAGRGIGLEKELAVKTDQHRELLLTLGAAGRLCLVGKLDVLPLDDEMVLEMAKSRLVRGKVVTNSRAAMARDRAMVQNILQSNEPIRVILLSAGRDLSERIEELDPHCGYVRVTTRKVAEIIGSR